MLQKQTTSELNSFLIRKLVTRYLFSETCLTTVVVCFISLKFQHLISNFQSCNVHGKIKLSQVMSQFWSGYLMQGGRKNARMYWVWKKLTPCLNERGGESIFVSILHVSPLQLPAIPFNICLQFPCIQAAPHVTRGCVTRKQSIL